MKQTTLTPRRKGAENAHGLVLLHYLAKLQRMNNGTTEQPQQDAHPHLHVVRVVRTQDLDHHQEEQRPKRRHHPEEHLHKEQPLRQHLITGRPKNLLARKRKRGAWLK